MTDKLSITTLLYDDFELLDVFGPLEMFGCIEDKVQLSFISEMGNNIRSRQGPISVVDYSFEDNVKPNILLVPGGLGSRTEVDNRRLIKWLQECNVHTQYTISVCTGSALLAKAGLLNDKKATTNKMAYKWVCGQGPKVNWQAHARWVEDGKFFSSSGVSAGIDMSIAVINKIFGKEETEKVIISTEYNWSSIPSDDPFAEIHGL